MAPWARPISSIRSRPAATAAGRPSTSARRTAAASVGKPACTKSSTARVMRWSIISSAAGTSPAAMTALTAAAASRTDGNPSSRVATAGGTGVSRTAMRVAMPSVPSLPTNAPRRS